MPVNKSTSKNNKLSSSSEKTKKKKTKKRRVITMSDDLAGEMSAKNHLTGKFKSKKIDDQEDLDMQRKLTEVYTDSDGEIPDLTKLETTQRPFWKTTLYTLIVVFSVLLIVAMAGFFIFSGWDINSFTNEKITLKIDTPISIVSGQESVYTILITNKEKVNLYNLELELFYPENFEYIDAAPLAGGDKSNKWSFSALKVGETQKIELRGVITGAIKSTQTFRGNLNFKPANLNATFKQDVIVDAIITSSVLNLEVEGPDKALANQEVEYILRYENLSEDDYTDLQVAVEYPGGFVFDSSEPESSNETHNIWDIKELKAGESGEIKITGNYSAVESSGNRDFLSRIQVKIDNDYYPQNEEILVTDVIKDQLSMQLIVNGSAEDQAISFGDLLVYSLNFKNTGEEDLEDIKITINLNSQILDWDTLKDENNGVIGQNSITYNGRHISKLLKLGSQEEGTINWQIRVKDASSVANQNVDKFSIESFAKATASQSGELSGESVVTSKTIVNSVNSDLDINVSARYYSEDNIPLGLGPIEPKAGETSTYNIKISLSNNLHDVEDVKFRAKLPANVFWANRENHEAGDIIYNAANNEVMWNISYLDRSSDTVTASFNVDISPDNDDKGRVLIMLSDISLSAKDSDTGSDINKNAQAITTSFNDPILGKISGIVQ
jgi:hypothetical protein